MITTQAVMDAARSVSIMLSDAYDRIRKLDAYGADSLERKTEQKALLVDLDGPIDDEVRRLRMVMRVELGASEKE